MANEYSCILQHVDTYFCTDSIKKYKLKPLHVEFDIGDLAAPGGRQHHRDDWADGST